MHWTDLIITLFDSLDTWTTLKLPSKATNTTHTHPTNVLQLFWKTPPPAEISERHLYRGLSQNATHSVMQALSCACARGSFGTTRFQNGGISALKENILVFLTVSVKQFAWMTATCLLRCAVYLLLLERWESYQMWKDEKESWAFWKGITPSFGKQSTGYSDS